MNIFYLDTNPAKAALYHNDVHCVKMILEAAQMLCTTHIFYNNEDPLLYRSTHVNHPCNIWLRESANNYRWLYELFVELQKQYGSRYNKVHHSYKTLRDSLLAPPPELPEIPMTPIRLAMPEEYKVEDAVQSYRNYYIGAKASISKWTLPAGVPEWFKIKETNETDRITG